MSEAFDEGYRYFEENAPADLSAHAADNYVSDVENAINETLDDLNSFEGYKTDASKLQGDFAEFYESGTYNINATVKESPYRSEVNRSHGLGSVDVSTNFGEDFSLKYRRYGKDSAQDQSISIFERFQKYKHRGGKESLEQYLLRNGYDNDEKILNDPLYKGQQRLIPADEYEEAVDWLKRKIAKESINRPEQVRRYQETLDHLTCCIEGPDGTKSAFLTRQQAEEYAALAKQGNITAETLGLSPNQVIRFEDVFRNACRAGLTAAEISAVLKAAPAVFEAIDGLVKEGALDDEKLMNIGKKAGTGAAEGFVRGTVAAALTSCCKAGILDASLENISPDVIAAVTVIACNTLVNAYKVVAGEKRMSDLVSDLIRDAYVSTFTVLGGMIGQELIQVPMLGYMLGSFVGSVVGSFSYYVGSKAVLALCVNTGFTMFGLVEQDYTLPDDVARQIGLDVLKPLTLEVEELQPEILEPITLEPETLQPDTLDIHVLRRGVIGVRRVGYV